MNWTIKLKTEFSTNLKPEEESDWFKSMQETNRRWSGLALDQIDAEICEAIGWASNELKAPRADGKDASFIYNARDLKLWIYLKYKNRGGSSKIDAVMKIYKKHLKRLHDEGRSSDVAELEADLSWDKDCWREIKAIGWNSNFVPLEYGRVIHDYLKEIGFVYPVVERKQPNWGK